MTSTQAQALILQDATGVCYAVPLELLAQCRLPDAVAAQLGDSQEVSGYLLPAVFQPLGVAAILGGSSFGTGVTAGKVHISDISIVKRTDKASPVLF